MTLPYTMELNDIPMMAVQHHESDYLLKRTIDQFDRLYAEGEKRAKILALAIHPYLSGQPHRIKYLEAIYDYARRFDGVEYWTGEEILQWYLQSKPAIAGVTLLLAATLASGTASAAAPCRTGGPYEAWLAAFEREAIAGGVSQRTVAEVAPYLTYDQRIVNIDSGQRVFSQTFLEFSDRMAAAYRIQTGAAKIKTYAQVFARIDQQYGVPAPVIVAFWALESDFGANMGKEKTLSALASLAYDCRRADRFRAQLLDALRLIERGDLRPEDMIGSWAGELGQTQMMPSEYFQYAVDYDGDGKRNLLRSAPDVLGSTANYLLGLGWKRGEPWLTEVRVPANLPWDQADLAIQLPRSKWASYGVTLADGRAAARRQSARVAAVADGAARTRLPRLREFPDLSAVEQLAGLFDHGGLSRHPHRRRAGAASRLAAAGARLRRHEGDANHAGARRLRRRQNRRLCRLENPAGGQGDAKEIRPAGGFLSDGGTARAHARGPLRAVETFACASRSFSLFCCALPRRPPRKRSPSRWCRACPAARPMWRSTRAISATPASTSRSSASIRSARRWRFSPPTRCRWRKAASMPGSTIRWRRACRWRWRWKAARRRPITRSSSAPI